MRRDNDTYYTLQAQTAIDALLTHVPRLNGPYIFEPCVGEGHLARALARRDRQPFLTNDIDQYVLADFHLDMAAESAVGWLSEQHSFDWAVTNPPFNLAFPMLKTLLPYAHSGVAFMVRLSFLEPTFERGAWLAEHPPDLVIVLPRMSFTGDGRTDSVTCAWNCWYKTDDKRLTRGIRIVPRP